MLWLLKEKDTSSSENLSFFPNILKILGELKDRAFKIKNFGILISFLSFAKGIYVF